MHDACEQNQMMNVATCGCRWYRDPNQPIARTDITRFPHAVLEVKLSLPEGQTAPEWVTDLTESGFLTEVSFEFNICREYVAQRILPLYAPKLVADLTLLLPLQITFCMHQSWVLTL